MHCVSWGLALVLAVPAAVAPWPVAAWQDDFALFKQADRVCIDTRLWDDPSSATVAPAAVLELDSLAEIAVVAGKRAVAEAGLADVAVVNGLRSCPVFRDVLASSHELLTLWITLHVAVRRPADGGPADAGRAGDPLVDALRLVAVAVTMQCYAKDPLGSTVLPVAEDSIPPDGFLYQPDRNDLRPRLTALFDRVWRRLVVAMTPILPGAVRPPALP
ncbi:MAG: hypothetical protein IT562_00605 [Alphaproteobacteria bacterium]|nr:hypothetical protein [Alphaproteobacteria bacterium]